jgi:hypothetical protein
VVRVDQPFTHVKPLTLSTLTLRFGAVAVAAVVADKAAVAAQAEVAVPVATRGSLGLAATLPLHLVPVVLMERTQPVVPGVRPRSASETWLAVLGVMAAGLVCPEPQVLQIRRQAVHSGRPVYQSMDSALLRWSALPATYVDQQRTEANTW